MPLKLTILFILFALSVKAQTQLYDDGNIRLTYTTKVLKTVNCSNKNGTIYFVTAKYHLQNYSNKDWFVNMAWGMTYVADGNLCAADDEVSHFFYQATASGVEGTVKAGANYYGEDGAWFTTQYPTPGWKIQVKSLWTTPKINTNTNTGSNTKTHQTKSKQPGVSIYQNDNVVNPKPQIDYTQKQKQEDAATDNAMKSWRSADSVRNDELRRLNSIPNTYKAPTNSQQQEEIKRRQQQIAAQQQEKLNQLQQRIEEQQRRYQQTQLDFANAQTAADNAYQAAIASGRKESGAMVDATLAASQQFSDPNAQLATLGVGLAASLFMHWGEKKQERLEREAALKREEERKQAIINAKGKYVTDALNINKYGFADLVSKQRYAVLLLTPKQNTPDEQSIYFTIPVLVPKYVDDTYPLKDEIEKKLLKSISLDKAQLANTKVYTLYPITDVEKFQGEFTKKMGSGHLIYLSTELTNFSSYPFSGNSENEATDFWGTSVKKENKTNKPQKNDFWNN